VSNRVNYRSRIIAVYGTYGHRFKSIRIYGIVNGNLFALLRCQRPHTFNETDRLATTCNVATKIKLAEYSHSHTATVANWWTTHRAETPATEYHIFPHSPQLPLSFLTYFSVLLLSLGTLYGVVFIYSLACCADFSNTPLTDKRLELSELLSHWTSLLLPPIPG